jgi:hypothetical protein
MPARVLGGRVAVAAPNGGAAPQTVSTEPGAAAKTTQPPSHPPGIWASCRPTSARRGVPDSAATSATRSAPLMRALPTSCRYLPLSRSFTQCLTAGSQAGRQRHPGGGEMNYMGVRSRELPQKSSRRLPLPPPLPAATAPPAFCVELIYVRCPSCRITACTLAAARTLLAKSLWHALRPEGPPQRACSQRAPAAKLVMAA